MRKAVKIGFGAGGVLLAALISWIAIGPDWRRLVLHAPADRDALFWRLDQRDAAFRMLDRVPFLADIRDIPAGPAPRPLPAGAPLDLAVDFDAYLKSQRAAGIVILHDGKVRLEAYGLGFGADGRWTSFSVAKSVTSTLVGAAIRDGHIRRLDDPVSDYVKGLKGSAYDDVTIEQLLTMTSGVAWNEDYDDPQSDVALFTSHEAEDGLPVLVSYMRRLPRAHPPGAVWNYSTGETNLIGVLVAEATGRPLADYLGEKIWRPYGMEAKATWLVGPDGREVGGCCLQAATRDFARFGQFMLEGANAGGAPVAADGWVAAASLPHVTLAGGRDGYGYQWWTFEEGAYAADGIFGQGIFIDPARRLVIASNASWTSANGDVDGEWAARQAFYRLVQEAIDREGA